MNKISAKIFDRKGIFLQKNNSSSFWRFFTNPFTGCFGVVMMHSFYLVQNYYMHLLCIGIFWLSHQEIFWTWEVLFWRKLSIIWFFSLVFIPRWSMFVLIRTFHGISTPPMSQYKYNEWLEKVQIWVHHETITTLWLLNSGWWHMVE